MFIDIHCHAYRKLPPVYSFSTPEQVIERYDAVGIEKGALKSKTRRNGTVRHVKTGYKA